MLTISGSAVIPLNGKVDDVLAGKRNALIEVTGNGALVDVYATGSAAGLEMESYVGKRNAIERSTVNTQNRVPVVPDDLVNDSIEALPGDRVTMPVYNTTAGNLTFFFTVKIREVPMM